MSEPEVRHFSFLALARFLLAFSSVASAAELVALCVLVVAHSGHPALIDLSLLVPLVYMLAVTSAAAAGLGAARVYLTYPQHRWLFYAVLVVTIVALAAHIYTINTPTTKNCYDSGRNVGGCVMDEIYYVPAAQTMLSGNQCAPYADNCNLEHPFLSKAFVAAGIQIFGNTTFGWRFFEVLLGTLSIPLLFGICWLVTRKKAFSLLATVFFATDTLFFVHSSAAVIDVHAIFFALLSFLLYFSGARLWRLDSYLLAGLTLGLSALSKETSIFFLLFLLTYNLLLGKGTTRARVLSSAKILIAVGVVFILGLQLYDSLLAPSQTFLTHVRFMLSYGASLRGNGWTDSVLQTPITPLNWFLYYSPIGYLITTVTVTSGPHATSYVGVGYYGVTNKIETWLTFLWAPYVVYLLYKAWRMKRSALESPDLGPEYKLTVFALLLLAWTYFPYLGLYLYGRVTYPYYMIQSVPAVSIGAAYFVTRPWFPRVMIYVLVVAVAGWFFVFYPDKSFLPTWLRVLIGR